MEEKQYTEEELKALFENSFSAFFSEDYLRQCIKDAFFDGYDTYADYIKYGDAFVPFELKEDDMNL